MRIPFKSDKIKGFEKWHNSDENLKAKIPFKQQERMAREDYRDRKLKSTMLFLKVA